MEGGQATVVCPIALSSKEYNRLPELCPLILPGSFRSESAPHLGPILLTRASPSSRELRAASLTRQNGKGNVQLSFPEFCLNVFYPSPACELLVDGDTVTGVRTRQRDGFCGFQRAGHTGLRPV